MTDSTQPPILNSFSPLLAPAAQPFQSYLPTAFSEDMTILQKMNYIINYLNTVTTTVNGVVTQWNTLMDWVLNDELKQDVIDQLTTWETDGTLDTIINQTVFGEINSRLDNMISVDIKDKGAKCDGITDDSTILQQWIDTLTTQTYGNLQGGVILIPGDMLVTKTIQLKSNVHLIGTGSQISRIRTNVGSSGNGLNVLQATEQNNITIRNLRIEGTGFGASGSSFNPVGSFTGAGSCIVMGNCTNVVIENCHLYNGGGYDDSDGVGNIWLSCCKNSKIINNIIEKSDNSICVDRWYSNYNADGVNRSGLYNDGIIISGNTCFNGSGRGVSMENINGYGSIAIVGNTFTSLQYAGIEGRDFTNCVIVGNAFEGSPMLKTFGDQTSNMQYGITTENLGQKCVIANNTFQNLVVHGISLLNANEFVITGNRISGVSQNDGIFIKNASNDNGVTGVNMNSGIVSNNLLNDVLVGIYIKRDSTDPSVLSNVQVSGNMIRFRSVGVQFEYVNYFNVVDNNLIPETSYNETTGIIATYTNKCQFVNNNIPNVTYGTTITNDTQSNFSNRLDTVTNGNNLTNCASTMFADFIRGGTIAYHSVSGNTGCDARKATFSGGVATYKQNGGILVRFPASAAPTDGAWDQGDTVDNTTPSAGGYMGWVCTTSGTGSPSTAVFKGFGAISV